MEIRAPVEFLEPSARLERRHLRPRV